MKVMINDENINHVYAMYGIFYLFILHNIKYTFDVFKTTIHAQYISHTYMSTN